MPKKVKNIFEQMVSENNIKKAALSALKNKHGKEIDRFKKNADDLLVKLRLNLIEGTFKPGKYRTMIITDPKERLIKIAPFYTDRIVHHVIMNVLEPIVNKVYVYNSYACVKGKGTHKCVADMYNDMRYHFSETQYCLKIDVSKFYDNIDHELLKSIVRRKIADKDVLLLIDSIIDSTESGIPIGNYTSQHFANLYLTYFDHYCKEILKLKYYYRYMDDIVILGESKDVLWAIFNDIKRYLNDELKLKIKGNYQVFPVDKRQIDFCGFKTNHHSIMLRNRILNKYYKRVNKLKRKGLINSVDDIKHTLPSHYGWLIHTSPQHSKTILKNSI